MKNSQVTTGQGKCFQLVDNLRVAEVLLCDNFIEMVAAVGIFLERVSSSNGIALARGQSSQVLLGYNVFVNTIETSLDDAKLHKSPDINVGEDVEASLLTGHDPLLHAPPWRKGGHELDEVEIANSASPMGYIAGAFVHHTIDIANEVVYARAGGVTRAEEEDIQEKDCVVVKKVADGGLGEVERDRGGMGDAADVGDAVDLSNHLLEGEIPCGIDDFGEFSFGDRDMPGLDNWRLRVERK